MSGDSRSKGEPAHYGTFQGVPPGYPQQPAVGFPQPVPPPGSASDPYYPHGYQAVPGYAVAEGRPVREPRLPCCGIGMGWLLFIIGFFLAAIPWYIGAFILICVRRVDYREKPGYIACTIANPCFPAISSPFFLQLLVQFYLRQACSFLSLFFSLHHRPSASHIPTTITTTDNR